MSLVLVGPKIDMSPEARAKWLHDALGFDLPKEDPTPRTPSVGMAQMSMASSDGAVRPSEIVAGASGVQVSSGEMTYMATADGQDFAEGARQAAQTNRRSGFARFGRQSNPMQSPDLADSGFFLRYGIGFLCCRYKEPYPSLYDIADYSQPNSAFLAAFKGLGKTHQYSDPKKSEIVSEITAWIDTLSKDLPASATGELVVTFQGHGVHGSFIATDGGELKPGEMMALAKQAEARRVSLTIVMDACYAGGAVPEFQLHAADAVDRRVDAHVEGGGAMSSPENHDAAELLRDEMAQARELILFSAAVAKQGDTLSQLSSEGAWGDPPYMQKLAAETNALRDLVRAMEVQFKTNMRFDHAPPELHDRIYAAFATLQRFLGKFDPWGKGDLDNLARTLGKFEDLISDSANQMLVALNNASAPS